MDNAPNYLVWCVIKKRLHFLSDFFALWTMNHLSAFRPIWSALIGQLKKHLNPIVTLNGLVKVNLCIQLRIFLHIQLKLKRRRCKWGCYCHHTGILKQHKDALCWWKVQLLKKNLNEATWGGVIIFCWKMLFFTYNIC